MNTVNMFFCIVVLLIWSSSSALVSVFSVGENPIILSGIVSFISLLLFSCCLFKKKNREIFKTISKGEYLSLLLPAFLGLFLYPIAYFCGIGGSNPLQANVLNYLWPLIAFIISIFLKKKKTVNFKEICSIVCAAIGAYIVMCFNNNTINSFNNNDLIYSVVALFGALFYGSYTAIINNNNSKASESGEVQTKLPASLRMLVMLFYTVIIHILIFLLLVIFNPKSVRETFIILTNKERIGTLLVYSMVNFSLAHFLWNRINTDNNIHITTNMAFYIPFISTIILSYISGTELNLFTSIGLVLIVCSTVLNNLEYINTINSTILSLIILLIFVGVTPIVISNEKTEQAKFFLEIAIALYAIFYSFLLNRAETEYKDVKECCNTFNIEKSNLEDLDKVILNQTIKELNNIQVKHSEMVNITSLITINEIKDNSIFSSMCSLYYHKFNKISIGEWGVTLILSALIIILCFIIRDTSWLSSFVVVSVGTTICLCVSALYEVERNKRKLLNTSLSV